MKFTIRLLVMLFSLGYVFSINYAGCQEQDDIIEAGEQFEITHKLYNSNSPVQDFVRYAYDISSGDLDFIYTLEAENNTRDMYRQSEYYKDGIREDSYGFCQLHRRWHSEIVDDKRFWSDPYWQLDKCWEKYKQGTKFYGYYVRGKVINRFTLN